MPPVSKFNPNYRETTNNPGFSPLRNSYDSKASSSSQDSHISGMSTASEDFAMLHHHHEEKHHHTHQRNTSTSSATYPSPTNHNKALPPSPPHSRSEKRNIAFASSEKPLPETPKHPHLAKFKDMSRRQKMKRTSSRDGGYVWYAQNCKRIHDQCEADGVCDLDRTNENLRD